MSFQGVMKPALHTFGLLLGLAALYFIVTVVSQNWDVLREGPGDMHLGYVLAAVLVLQIYWFYQIGLWQHVLASYGERASYFHCCMLFFSNGLLAYVPGKVANLVGMAMLAKRKGFSSQNAVTTVILFQVYSLISGTFLIGIASLFVPEDVDSVLPLDWLWILGVGALFGLLMISPVMQSWTIALLRAVTKKNISSKVPPFGTILLHVLLYAVGWILPALVVWSLLHAILPAGEGVSLLMVIIVFIGSYLVGLLAVVVPAGLGVTEAGLVLGFGTMMNPGYALWAAASFRIIVVASTFASWLVIWFIERKNKQ